MYHWCVINEEGIPGSAITHTNQDLVSNGGVDGIFCSFSNIYCYKMLHSWMGKGSAFVPSLMCLFAASAGISISLICGWLQSSTGCSWWEGSEETWFCFKGACWFPLIVICSWVLLVQGLGHPSDRDLLSIPCVEVLKQVVCSYFTSSWCEMGLPADQAITDGRDLRRHLTTPQAGILSLGWHRGAYTHFSTCEVSPVE